MSRIHICNSFFEKELEPETSCRPTKPLAAWLRSHPIFLQLQFLPLLYAKAEDRIAVSDLPDDPDPRLTLLDSLPPLQQIEHWGASLSLQAWAASHSIPYSIPKWEVVREINSKIFSFLQSPRLPGSALLETDREVTQWIAQTPGPKVLKTAFGTAGNGHFHIGAPHLSSFLRQQFDKKLPLIGEPWVDRVFDFSTQWENGKFLGITVFENDSNGTYKGTLAGPLDSIFGSYRWALEEHLSIAKPLVEKIAAKGFTGNLGIDAYIYRADRERLQPIVEINGRKTMSWTALQIQQEKYPGKLCHFQYARGVSGLLPSSLTVQGKRVPFSRNVICSLYRDC